MATKFYVKRVVNAGDATDTANTASQANGGSIIKTASQVGIFKGAQSGVITTSGTLNSNKGQVYSQSGTNFMPSRSNIQSLIDNTNVKNAFNKFFTNTTGDAHNTSSSATGPVATSTNLNAFAYMKANGVEGYKF